MSDITSLVVAILGGIASLCAGVWWLSRLSMSCTQTSRDVQDIKATTKTISDNMISYQHILTDHDKRIKTLEKECR
jgi:hypothetical protein